MKERPLQPGWWMQSKGYRIYALREFSGVLIAAWAIHHLLILIIPGASNISPFQYPESLLKIKFYADPFLKTGELIDYLGIMGAIIHTITWLSVMPKILPLRLTERGELIAFFILILITVLINAAILLA